MKPRATLNLIRQTARTLGVDLPSEVGDAVTTAERLVTAAQHINRGDLTSRVLDHLAQGTDYYTDKSLQRLMLDTLVVSQGIVPAAEGRGDDSIGAALVEHTDTILTAWAKALEPHSAALAAAAEVLPEDLDNIDAVKKAGGEAMHHWANTQHAIKLWRAAVQGFRQVAAFARITAPDARIVMTAADPADLPAEPWTLACNGIPLSLPSSLGEFMERSAHHAQRRAEQAAPAEESAPV
ncbi:hypothetical protein [Mycolicibacterium monacense]|uniref:hypothetical protein n=1 Tax=Mycolicibacterium monacense TaxID=85693 RepID=UPI0007EB8B0A|nr:hypothetical protein [Mycolicibacterium monacense]OBF52534.1 hypothetical protein A5778_15555 [Mycolicibacterium monacense]